MTTLIILKDKPTEAIRELQGLSEKRDYQLPAVTVLIEAHKKCLHVGKLINWLKSRNSSTQIDINLCRF